jgi:SAM-dependent methyltransferase
MMSATERSTTRAVLPLQFPHPGDGSRSVCWNGHSFDLDGREVRVLAYDVSPSGWTDELTALHERSGGSDHFIDMASRAHAVAEVRAHVDRVPSTILEIGCSSGFLLADLVGQLQDHVVLGSDYTRGTLEALGCRLSHVPLLQFDLTRCPLPDASIDAIVLLNVLEHIEDDAAAARELFRIVRPGGAVVIEVPAGSSLFDVYDRVLMHFRRYDMRGLVELLTGAGFVVERRSHLGVFLYPLFHAVKRLNQLRFPTGGTVDEEAIIARLIESTRKSSRIMNWVMRLESGLRQLVYLPLGVRCLVTCRKPGGVQGINGKIVNDNR